MEPSCHLGGGPMHATAREHDLVDRQTKLGRQRERCLDAIERELEDRQGDGIGLRPQTSTKALDSTDAKISLRRRFIGERAPIGDRLDSAFAVTDVDGDVEPSARARPLVAKEAVDDAAEEAEETRLLLGIPIAVRGIERATNCVLGQILGLRT